MVSVDTIFFALHDRTYVKYRIAFLTIVMDWER